uniref:Uncharacterized protein n=1 Tax=Romanomermis culicivorax TaxID=13658 RepID=A0A915JF91_ROMCU
MPPRTAVANEWHGRDKSLTPNSEKDFSVHTVIIRHGERVDNVWADWRSAYVDHPVDDCPLSKRGRYQAERIAQELFLFKPKAVFSSPYQRCLSTMAPAARRKSWEIKIEPGLGEVLDEHNYPPQYLIPHSIFRYYKDVPFDFDYNPVAKFFSLPAEPNLFRSERRIKRVINELMIEYGLTGMIYMAHRFTCNLIVSMYTGESVTFEPGTMAFLKCVNNKWIVDYLVQS